MSELVLRRVLTRSRRRKPRPPRWWFCLLQFVICVTGAVSSAARGEPFVAVGCVCISVTWWRCLHSPPRYYCHPRSFWVWWPPGIVFMLAGTIGG